MIEENQGLSGRYPASQGRSAALRVEPPAASQAEPAAANAMGLKPCPFCGGTWLTIEAACYVHCKSCCTDGPVFDNWSEDTDYRVEVAALWNERQSGGEPFAPPPLPRLGGNITPSEWLRSIAGADRKIRANARANEGEAIADWIDRICASGPAL